MTYHSIKRRLMYPLGDDAATFDFSAMNSAVNPEPTPTNPGSVTSWGSIAAAGAASGAGAGTSPSAWSGNTQPTNNGGSGSPSLLSSFGSGLATGGGMLLGAAQAGARAQGAASAYQTALYQQQAMPTWLMPVALGGIAIVAVMMLTKPPRAATSNPARRRRRRRGRR